MSRRHAIATAAWLVATTGRGDAQPRPPRLDVTALDSVVTPGPGVKVRLRLTDRADGRGWSRGRVVGAHAVSPGGALVSSTGVNLLADGIYEVRAAMQTPGRWTITLEVAEFDRSPIVVATTVDVSAAAPSDASEGPRSPATPSPSAVEPISPGSPVGREVAPQG